MSLLILAAKIRAGAEEGSQHGFMGASQISSPWGTLSGAGGIIYLQNTFPQMHMLRGRTSYTLNLNLPQV